MTKIQNRLWSSRIRYWVLFDIWYLELGIFNPRSQRQLNVLTAGRLLLRISVLVEFPQDGLQHRAANRAGFIGYGVTIPGITPGINITDF